MSKNFIFSSESVGEGHPDKVCDTISDAVLDACLRQDKHSRVACETYAKSNLVVVGGEITTSAKLDFNAIAREAIREIGYTHEDDVFHADKVLIMNAITSQSPDIAQGVDARRAKGKEKAEILDLLHKVPTIVDIYLGRPAVIPEISAASKGLLANYGSNDKALLDVIFGNFNPAGKLHVEMPSSMDAVWMQKEDVPYDSENPLYPFGFGLQYEEK